MVTRSVERFWSKVNRDGPVPQHAPDIGQCWIWTAGHYADGYGIFKDRGTMWRAPRFSWLVEHGKAPAENFVLHHCDNRSCVRPSHLFLGDQQANMADRQRKNRQCFGSKNGRAKLTEQQVIAIRALIAQRELSKADIGRRYGVTSTQVYLIGIGKTWSHIPW